MLKILQYKESYQRDIDAMVNAIACEFEFSISNGNPLVRQALDRYWVAFDNDTVIGAVAILNINNRSSIFKNMFVKKEYRGSDYGTAQLLLNTAVDCCRSESSDTI